MELLKKYEKEELKKVLKSKERSNKDIEKFFNKRVNKNILFDNNEVIARYYNFLAGASVEYFCIACFDTKYKLISNKIISKGSISQCMVYKRELLQYCLLCDAINVVVFHNHPSGNYEESEQDIELTKDLKRACNIIGINLADSIIIVKDGFRSLHEYL